MLLIFCPYWPKVFALLMAQAVTECAKLMKPKKYLHESVFIACVKLLTKKLVSFMTRYHYLYVSRSDLKT